MNAYVWPLFTGLDKNWGLLRFISFFIGFVSVVPFIISSILWKDTPIIIYLIAEAGIVAFFGTGIGFILNLLVNNNIVLDNHTLTAPCKVTSFIPLRTITVNISDINLSKSSVSFFGGTEFVTKDDRRIIISVLFHSRKCAQNLFDEIESLQSIQND